MFTTSITSALSSCSVDDLAPGCRQQRVPKRAAVNDTPAAKRFIPNSGKTTLDTPLPERLASLTIGSSAAALTPLPAASFEVCPTEPIRRADDSAYKLQSALTALASGGLCSPEQIATLQQEYGSIKPLVAHLGPTLLAVDGLSLSCKEWQAVVQQYPLALARVPKELLLHNDSLYVGALCASQGCAEVIAQLPQGHEKRLYRLAFDEDPTLIELLPACERTPEDYKAACIKRPETLPQVPEEVQTEAFLLALCTENPRCFRYIDDHKKTEQQATLVCKKAPSLLKHVPTKLRSDDLYKMVCLQDWAMFDILPEELRTEQFCLQLVKENGWVLSRIPPDKMTAEMCEYACFSRPDMLRHVPVRLQTESLYQKVLDSPTAFLAYRYLPRDLVPFDKYREMCKKHGHLDSVPNDMKNADFYRLAAAHGCLKLYEIVAKDRTQAHCLQSGLDKPCGFHNVPDPYIDLSFLFSVMGGKNNLSLHRRAQKLLKEEDYTTFLCISALYRTDTQLKLLTWPDLPEHFRSRLIDFLAGTGAPLSLKGLPKHALINLNNPLRFQLYNPLVSKLLLQAHTARNYQPTCQADGQAWLHYLKEQLPKYLDKPLPPIDSALAEPLQTGHIEAKGGRTLQVKNGDTIYYYKFQRKGEPLKELVREGLIHQFRAEHPQGAWAKLASDLPTDPHFFQLEKSMWPSQKADFKDEVEVHKEGEREWLNVYRYTASADYGRYAHQPDREADCPFKKPEDAILTACYDMGLFASMGLMLTSMLPAMHNSKERRSWQTLYDLFGDRGSTEVHPGTLGAWNSTATEHCDIGFNGLRDVGDYEQFGTIQSCFSKSEDDGTAQPFKTGQRLAVAGTLCDNVMAAVLIRSRLRQQDGNYHYRKGRAVADTACFIDAVCDHLLTGLAGKGKGELQPGITRKMMGFEKPQYEQWLHRTAFEIVYWTALQPDSRGGKITTVNTVSFDPLDGWATHLQQEHNLSSTLYDPEVFVPDVRDNTYPDHFINPDHKDNLGGHSAAFPFLSLVQGLTSLGGDILARSDRLSPPEADDTAMERD